MAGILFASGLIILVIFVPVQTDIITSTGSENVTTISEATKIGGYMWDIVKTFLLILCYTFIIIFFVLYCWCGVYTLPMTLATDTIEDFIASVAYAVDLFFNLTFHPLLHWAFPNLLDPPFPVNSLAFYTLFVVPITSAYSLLNRLFLPPIRNTAIFFCLLSLSPFVLALPMAIVMTFALPFFTRFHLPLPNLDTKCGLQAYPLGTQVVGTASIQLAFIYMMVMITFGLYHLIRFIKGYDNAHNVMPRFRVLMIVVAEVAMAILMIIRAVSPGGESSNQQPPELGFQPGETQIVLWSTQNETQWLNYINDSCKSDRKANESLGYSVAIVWVMAAGCALVSMAVWRPHVEIESPQVTLDDVEEEQNDEEQEG